MADESQRGEEKTRPLAPGEQLGTLSRFAALRAGGLFAGRYEIVRRLGAGGAGEVFHARDRVAAADVALKVLFPRGDDGEAPLERLRRELRIVRGTGHPGIVRIHDIGLADGLLYLVMDLYAGQTLRDRLVHSKRLAPADAERVLHGMLEALAAAHAQGVMHRDIKPANVFLAREPDGSERIVLLDFGLARNTGNERLTATGQFLGTPEYVAPEQARGDRAVGPACDVYAVGVVLWEMLAGAPPFVADSAIDVITAHLTRPLPPVRKALGDAPDFLRDLAEWMLEKDNAARPADAGAALAFLLRRRRRGVWARLKNAIPWTRLSGGAFAAMVLLALGALYGATRVPTDLWLADKGQEVVAVNVMGATVRRDTPPAPAKGSAPYDVVSRLWSRRHLLLLGKRSSEERGFPDSVPSGITSYDLLSGTFNPFPLFFSRGQQQYGTPLPAFPRYDNRYFGRYLTRLPDYAGNTPYFAAVYHHHEEYPNVLAVFDRTGTVVSEFLHPGAIEGTPVCVPADTRGGAPYLAGAATNNLLGSRAVVFATGLHDEFVVAPPLDLPRFDRNKLVDYIVLSIPGAAETRLDPLTMQMTLRDARSGAERTVDLRRRVPVSAVELGPLDEAKWRAAEDGLINLLVGAAATARDKGPLAAAGKFEEFAAPGRPLGPAQRGTALAQAARLHLAGGDPAGAERLARQCLEIEPLIEGHARLIIAAMAQQPARWGALEDLLDPGSANAAVFREAQWEHLLAGAITGRLDATERALALFNDGYYRISGEFFSALSAADPVRLGALVRRPLPPSIAPDQQFIYVLAGTIADQPRLDDATRQLAAARAGRGNGRVLPFVPLEAWLDALNGRPLPARQAIDGALREQEEAARACYVIEDLYYLPWAYALAGAAELRAGDAARGVELMKKAEAAAHGPRPFIDLLRKLGQRPN